MDPFRPILSRQLIMEGYNSPHQSDSQVQVQSKVGADSRLIDANSKLKIKMIAR